MGDAPNISSRLVWNYEATPGTAAITAADSVSYEFGNFSKECDKWSSPFEDMDIVHYYNYAERNAYLEDGEAIFPTWKISYHPTTAQFLGRIMKNPTTGDPIDINLLHSGYTYPITIRLEENEGDNEQLVQTVGNYCIGMYCRGMRGSEVIVEEEFAFQSVEDHDDRVKLTTAPLAAGSDATYKIKNSYDGNPVVIWDKDGEDIAFDMCYMAEFSIIQKYTTVSTDEGTKQLVRCYEYQPISIILSGILDTTNQWDDYRDRTARDIELKFWKPDMSNYISCIFDTCKVKTVVKTGIKYKGYYEAKMVILAQDLAVTSNFLDENPNNFAYHFKAGVT